MVILQCEAAWRMQYEGVDLLAEREGPKWPLYISCQQKGWLLVDATYQPVNALDTSSRDAAIVRDYPLMRDDLRALAPERVVLIKANVCLLLEPKLIADGFRVINAGRTIYFPSNGRQRDFRRQFAEIVLGVVP
jgi:hypothetical protein